MPTSNNKFSVDSFLAKYGNQANVGPVVPQAAPPSVAASPSGSFDPDAFIQKSLNPATQSAPPQQQQPYSGPELVSAEGRQSIPSEQLPTQMQIPGSSGSINTQGTASLETNVPAEETAARQIKSGLNSNLTFKAVQAADKAITGDSLKTPEVENAGVLGLAASLADPFGMQVAAGAAKVLPAAKMLGLTSKVNTLTKAVEAVAPNAELGLSNAAAELRRASAKLIAAKMGQAAVNGPIEFGAFEGAREAGKQLADGEFDPSKIVAATGRGALLGAPASIGLTALGLAATPLAKRLLTKAPAIDKSAIIQEAYDDAQTRVGALVGSGRIAPENASLVMQKQFLENLDDHGYPAYPNSVAKKSGTADNFLFNLERFSNLDGKLGTNTTQVIHNNITGENEFANLKADLANQVAPSIKRLNKLGVDNNAITNFMRHVEDTPDGDIVFNPSALEIPNKVSRPDWNGPLPSPEVMAELKQLRAFQTNIAVQHPEFADRIGYLDGYVPIEQKSTGSYSMRQPKMGQLAAFMKARESGVFDPNVHETDYGVLMDHYINRASKFLAFDKHMPTLISELNKLSFLDQGEAAEALARVSMRSMGIRDKLELGRVFADRLLSENSEVLAKVSKTLPQPQSLLDEVGRVVRNATYNNLVFTNPRGMIKHAFQPELVGSAEIGPRWVGVGRKSIFNKQDRALAKSVMPLLKAKDASVMEDVGVAPIANKALRATDKVLSIPAIPGKYIYNAEDTLGRMTSFLGAYKQLKHEFEKGGEGAFGKVLDGLLYGEKNLVTNAYKKGGLEAAAQMYGIVRARRIHYAYGIANTPEVLASGLGKYVPFTTWGGNQLMRFLGDIRGRNYAQLARRIALPLMYIGAFKALTGYEVPGAHPLSAVPEALKLTPNPALAEAAEAYSKGDAGAAGKAALNFTPVGPFRRAIREYGTSNGDFLQYGLKLKPVEGDAVQRALPDFIRKSLYNE